jgi:putative FmdB family regulatory protein
MPLYEYQCDSCGARFELIRKFSDPPLSVCPTCGAEAVRKLISSPAFQFKGSGWYVTDYAKKSGDGDSAAASKAAAESKADATSDAKSASKGSAAEAASHSKETTAPVAAADKPAAAPAVASPSPAPPASKDK